MRDAAQIVLDCRVLADDAVVSSWLQQPHTRRLDRRTGGMPASPDLRITSVSRGLTPGLKVLRDLQVHRLLLMAIVGC